MTKQWKEHINTDAVIASAILSFDQTYRQHFDVTDMNKAKNWLENFGVEYLMYYHNQNNIVSRSKLRLTFEQQYLAFKCTGDVFVDLNSNIQRIMSNPDNRRDARLVWRLYLDVAPELYHVAIAILSIASSEASVERSFSAYGRIHSKLKNRSSNDNIVTDMHLMLNQRALNWMHIPPR